MKDPYSTLGVSKTATDKEIRSAYRKLAKEYHPDHNPNDRQAEERFKAVGQAYAIIGDKDKRARYDRGEIDADGQERAPFGAGGFGGNFRNGGQGFRGGGRAAGPEFAQEDLSAFFTDMFGGGFSGDFQPGGPGGRRATRGEDRHFSVTIPFEQAVLGTTLDLTLGGSGHTEVRVPPGVESGQTLRVRGKGGPGRTGPDGQPGVAGDALLTITVTPDPRYTREGRNLRVTQDVDLTTAVLGGKLRVPTPKGTVTMTVPRHADSGTVLRLGGRGIGADKKHPAGDLLVTLRVKIGTPSPALEAALAAEMESP